MPALICILFIAYLFWTDSKKSNGHSIALWIPFFWMFLAGSRYASSWLGLTPPSAEANAEGSPLDRAVFFLLIAAGVLILSRRKIDWNRLLIRNKWIMLYYLYCLLSIIWTDDSFITLKRWIKDLGNPIMALVILTEQPPYKAVEVILRRLAFLLLPLSLLFIKYYPELGRAYHNDGSPMYTGVGHQKNDLGLICLITGIYFSWKFLRNRKRDSKLGLRGNITDFTLMAMLAWLLRMSDSQTSLACLVITVSILVVSRITFIAQKPSRIVVLGISSALLYSVLESTLHVKDIIFEILGRDPTLTGRAQIWEMLREFEANPIVGSGFMSFWTGNRREAILQKIGAEITQAHNGYLELYLNLGYIGVTFLGVIILSGLFKVRKQLDVSYPSAILRLCVIVTAIFYNYTEASFYGINNMWLLFLLAVIEVPEQQGITGTETDYRSEQDGKGFVVARHRYKQSYSKSSQE